MSGSDRDLVFAALGDACRRLLLDRLRERNGQTLAALTEGQGISRQAVTKHLKVLEQAGLVTSRRESRSIIYTANYDGLSGLVEFLMRDCCQGRPEVCVPAGRVAADCCSPNTMKEAACAC